VNRESKVLDLIHSDLCDFHANPSLGHDKYVITFIDDASRYCYGYLLHVKHEALDKFKIYKQEVELQRQDLIKVLRTDRGEPSDYVSVNSIIESKDAIFDEERFTSIPRPREKALEQEKLSLLGLIFNHLVEGMRDKTLSQREYYFIIEEKMKVDGSTDKYKARLVIQGFRQKERIDFFDTYAPVARISTIRLLLALATIHDLVIHQMDVKTAFLNGYSDASWINNMEDHSSTSGWVFLLGGGAISWASKKQTCITSSTMESEFVALAAAGNEVEWLRNLVYDIPLWPKPISTISIRCDSA
nr:zinc finger, CCHC-type [Tanacetum cinerariifolium]